MKWIILLGFMLSCTIGYAQQPAFLGVGGGVAVPVGADASDYGKGFTIGAMYGFSSSGNVIQFVLLAEYTQHTRKTFHSEKVLSGGETNLGLIAGGAQISPFGSSGIRPYILPIVGVSRGGQGDMNVEKDFFTIKDTVVYPSEPTKSGIAIGVGLGVVIPLSQQISLAIESRFISAQAGPAWPLLVEAQIRSAF